MLRSLALLIMLLVADRAVFANGSDRYLLIVTGIGGEPYYSERFERRARTLLDVAEDYLAIPADQIVYLADGVDGVPRSDREAVLAALDDIAARSRPDDRIMMVLIGHGSIGSGGVLFNLPGPDLSADDLADRLAAFDDRQLAIINASSASAPFINALSAPERIVITATSSGAENQFTQFADPFVAAFADPAADADKDRQVSLLEAFDYANREVERHYRLEGLIRTEHAQLDDNGDGQGSREPGADNGDGSLAQRFTLVAAEHGDDPVSRARIQLQIQARRLVDRVEALKRLKPSLETDDYQTRLEQLLIELALNRRAWREAAP